MGVCCFTPRKTEFLWWYWLLLASIVGVPMFLAALFVARRADSEEQKRAAGKRAWWIFLAAAVVSFALATVGVLHAPKHVACLPLVFGYLVGIIVVNAANEFALRRNRTSFRILAVVGFLGGWYVLWVLSPWGQYAPRNLSLSPALEFLVCMLPAQAWGTFTRASTRRNACMFLAALVAGAFFYWAVVRYGDVQSAYSLFARIGRPNSVAVGF
ncbi:MAG: hypothetical protein ABSA67_17600 [Candidatus Brocadiia bacterium]|jgi:hypothetical protein